MPINNLPAALQSVIQTGQLEHAFRMPLRAKLGFRSIADQEPFPAGIGETITKTRTGLLPTVTTPMAPASNADITSGLTPQNYGIEQFILGVNQYAANMQLNIATSRTAIASLYVRNAMALSEQAARSVDALAQVQLFEAYCGGNTFVRVTLGATGPTIQVDDIRGFRNTWDSAGRFQPVSGTNPINVTVGASVYSLIGFAADGTNVSKTPGGISGTLTFSTNVTLADGTLNNAVSSAVAPLVMRPMDNATNTVPASTVNGITTSLYNAGRISMQMILQAKAQLSANGVPPVAETGMYHLYLSAKQAVGLFNDNDFKLLFRGEAKTPEYRRGIVADLLGAHLIETNLNPTGTFGANAVQYGILCGSGALVEGGFTSEAYRQAQQIDDDGLIVVADGIAHVTREPLDALKQVVTQTWSYIGGFAVPSDITTNPQTIPTASNSAYKRAVLMQSL
ncbi:MAG: hypothetical protein KGI52_06605 [Burkholderiales bacterium]|nr:hypothetical protein [Burkholderiales bacterium]